MEAKRLAWPRLYCGSARGQIVTLQNEGALSVESRGAISRRTRAESSSGFNFAAAGSVAPPTKEVRRAWPSGARPGNRDEFHTVPSIRRPAERSEEHTSELQSPCQL